ALRIESCVRDRVGLCAGAHGLIDSANLSAALRFHLDGLRNQRAALKTKAETPGMALCEFRDHCGVFRKRYGKCCVAAVVAKMDAHRARRALSALCVDVVLAGLGEPLRGSAKLAHGRRNKSHADRLLAHRAQSR